MSNKTDKNRKKNTGSGKQPAHWSGVFAMTLCVFALIASEFMPVSLLTPMAQTLRVTEGMAGQGIAISGAFAVVTSLFISVLAGTLNRKALATVVAAPLGSWLGSVVGWRGAFFCLVPVAIIAFVWQLLSLPSMSVTRQAAASRNVFMLFRRRVVTLGMLGVGIFFMGQFTLFTYIRPFLETVTRVDDATVTLVLLVIGVAGFIGTTLIGRVLKRGFYPTLMAIPVLMAITALALIAFGSQVAIVTALLGLWGLISTAAPVGWWAWVPRTFPQNAEAGGGLMVAMVQLSIALGSTVGGLLFDHHGYQSTFLASAAMLIIATVLIFLTSRADTSAADHS